MSKEKSNNKSAIVMIYHGSLTGDTTFKKAIVCSSRAIAEKYLIKKGYAKEENTTLSKTKKRKIREQNLLYINKSKNRVAGILQANFYK